MAVQGTKLTYIEQGTGPTILFVHGAGGDWRSWEGFMPIISSRFRFVSLSRRYHFPNSWDDDASHYSFDQDVEDLASFIKAMNVGKVHLVGNSYGGRLVGYVALKYPDLLHSVVLGEPSLVAPTTPEGKAAMARLAKDFGEVRAAATSGDDKKASILLVNAVLDDSEAFNKLSSERQQKWLQNAKTMKPLFTGPPPAPVTCEKLKAIKLPVLVVRGQNTRDSYTHGHEALLLCLPPTAKSMIVPGASHAWPADNPATAATGILEFLNKQ